MAIKARNMFCMSLKINISDTYTFQHASYITGLEYLKVSRIMVKSTNFPSSGTTSEVGGMISASSRKNTVSDSRMEMDKLT